MFNIQVSNFELYSKTNSLISSRGLSCLGERGLSASKALAESFMYCRVSEDLRKLPSPIRVLAASRLCVLPMTAYAVALGGIMAWIDGSFSWPLFIAILIGFLLAHLADNLLNDMTDVKKGIDEPGYFRSLYGPHPIIDGIVSVNEVKFLVGAILIADLFLALYLGFSIGWLIPLLAFLGALVMSLYGGFPIDAKKLGLGELLVAIVWGPVIVGGTYLAIAGSYGLRQAYVYLPYAAAVSLVLIGKHLDKFDHDLNKGLKTLPIRLGKRRSRFLASSLAILSLVTMTIGIYFYTGSFWSLLLILALPYIFFISKILVKEKPKDPPKDWPVWPLWYAAWGFAVLDLVGRYAVLSLIITGVSGLAFYILLVFIVLMWIGDLRRFRFIFSCCQ